MEYEVLNIVIKTKLYDKVDLDKLSYLESEEVSVEYEPAIFPGANVKILDGDKVYSIILFKNGNVIIPGLKSLDNVEDVIKTIKNKIDKLISSASEQST